MSTRSSTNTRRVRLERRVRRGARRPPRRRRSAASRARRWARPRSGRGATPCCTRARALSGSRAPSASSSAANVARRRRACPSPPGRRAGRRGSAPARARRRGRRRRADGRRGARSGESMSVFITVEGLDGAGKTTLVRGLARRAGRHRAARAGRRAAGRADPRRSSSPATPSTRAPRRCCSPPRGRSSSRRDAAAPGPGETVVLDRFVDSSLAYQGAGPRPRDRASRAINAFATGGLRPTARCCCASTRRPALARVGSRAAAPRPLRATRGVPGARRRPRYDALAAAEPERCVVLDATQPPDAVLRHALRGAARSRPGWPGARPRRRRSSSRSPACAAPSRAPPARARTRRRASAGRPARRASSIDGEVPPGDAPWRPR